MARQPLFGASRMASRPLGNSQASDVLVLDLHEIVAGKIVALFSRRAARDLFDARRILKIEELNWHRIKAAVLAIGASGRRDWRSVSVDSIDGDRREFYQKLAICLPRGRFAGKREVDAWINETVEICREKLAFLFELSTNEQAFLDGILDRGSIEADLLDLAPEFRLRVETMPMLVWKCLHVRANRGQTKRDG